MPHPNAADHLMMRPDLWRDLREYQQLSRSTGCSHGDYWELYQTTRRLKPAEVLECGAGISTVAIAHALKKNSDEGHPGRVTTMEEHRRYYDEAARLLPAALRPYVEHVLSERVDATFSLFRGTRYAKVPERPYTLVFVDGPDCHAVGTNTLTCNLDYIEVVRRSLDPVYGIVDGRFTTVFMLQSVFGRSHVRCNINDGLTRVGPFCATDIPPITIASVARAARDATESRDEAMVALGKHHGHL
jgi:hypothetical protein